MSRRTARLALTPVACGQASPNPAQEARRHPVSLGGAAAGSNFRKEHTMNKLFTLVVPLLLAGAALAATAATPAGTAPTTRVSVSTAGAQGNRDSFAAGITANGRFVVINSLATNLVPGDTNDRYDVFVRDTSTGATTRVSVSSRGAQAARGKDAFGGSLSGGASADGRYVVFQSDASNLVRSDTNRAEDVFVHDRKTGRTARLSVDSHGRQANGSSWFPAISADGRYVAFQSIASNLVRGDTNRLTDVFVRDLATGKTTRVSVNSHGAQARCKADYCESTSPVLSARGRYVAFQSSATNLVAHDTNRLGDVFLHDRRTGKTIRISVRSDGKQAGGDRTNTGSNAPAISADGRFVAFHSLDTNLVPGDTNRTADIYVHDLKLHRTTRVSVSSAEKQSNGESLGGLTISADGRFVAFTSLASNLVPRDANDITDVFLRDMRTGTTTLVSRGIGGVQGDDASAVGGAGAGLELTNGARVLAFSSWAANFVPGDTNDKPDAFVRRLRR
jgi:Tol biopolymer transport system component